MLRRSFTIGALQAQLAANLFGVDLAELVRLGPGALELGLVLNTEVPAVVEAHGQVKVEDAVVEVIVEVAAIGEPELVGYFGVGRVGWSRGQFED